MLRLSGRLQPALLAALAIGLAGCFTFRSTIRVGADGRGTVTETLALSGPALRMMRGSDAPLSTPEALAVRAARLGDGVTVVRSDTSGGVRTTVYAFRDIGALQFRMPDNASEDADVASVAHVPPLYTFAFEPAAPGGAPTLRIAVAEPLAVPAPEAPDSTSAERLALARILLGDARATVEVVVDGETLATDADVHAGPTTTLLDLAFESLFDLVGEHPVLMGYADPPLDEIRRLGAGRGGIAVQAPGTVTVRFR